MRKLGFVSGKGRSDGFERVVLALMSPEFNGYELVDPMRVAVRGDGCVIEKCPIDILSRRFSLRRIYASF